MAKAKNLLLAGLLALVSLFSIGLFAACGNEAENKGGNEPAEVQAVAIGDVTVISNDKQAKLSTFTNEISVLGDNHNREFTVQVLVNDAEVASFDTRLATKARDELNKVSAVVKSGDVIVINYEYNHYLLQDGDYQAWFFLGNPNVLLSTNDENITASQTFVVA